MEHSLEGLAILGELLDTFVKLVESHLVLKKLPAEFGLIVNIGNFLDWNLRGGSRVEFPGDGISAVPQLLKECGRDSEEVHACECLDLTGLNEIHEVSITGAWRL
jgi:hypothetical protein